MNKHDKALQSILEINAEVIHREICSIIHKLKGGRIQKC